MTQPIGPSGSKAARKAVPMAVPMADVLTDPDGPDAVAVLETPVGLLTILVSQLGLAGVGWGDRRPSAAGSGAVSDRRRAGPAVEQLTAYFAGELTRFDLPLDLRGISATSRTVLETLCEKAPYGSSVTYGELAHSSNTGVPARGIGSIMGSNPIPIVVPCHRVLASTGLGGYSGGLPGDGLRTKRWLLTLEGVLQPTLDWIDPRSAATSDG